MAEFFNNIWSWISAHSAQIAAVLTPANLVLLISTIVSLFRQKKTIVYNTAASGNVDKKLKDIASIKEIVNELKKENAILREQNGDLSDQMTQAIAKLNAVLSVQESAYNASSLPKDTLVTIHNLIANGKFAESKSRLAVNEEMASLKGKIAELLAAGESAEKKVQKLTKAEEKPSSTGVRYD